VRRLILLLVFPVSVISGLIYMGSLFESPVRYLVVLPMFVSMFFIPNINIKARAFLKIFDLMFVVFLAYCAIVLSLVESNLPPSKSWMFALILTLWSSFVKLINSIRLRGATS